MARPDNSNRPGRQTCWNCGASVRSGRSICLTCGATLAFSRDASAPRLPADFSPAPPYPSGPATYAGPELRTPYTADPAERFVGAGSPHDPLAASDLPAWYRDRETFATHITQTGRALVVASVRGIARSLARAHGTRLTNLLFAIGFGLLGSFLGGAIWYVLVVTFRLELGFFALPLGYLTGRGVALGTATRSFMTTLLAMTLAWGTWDVCALLVTRMGYTLTVSDLAFLLVTVAIAALPTRSLPLREY
jgi:hypothetical protein